MHLNPQTTSVFILAAGRGERMRPLTDHTPKPLLTVQNKSLLEHHLQQIAEQGFKNVVINVAHLGQQIINQIGGGKRFGLSIKYSDESLEGALETAGGIRKALDLIKSPHFICINADIWTDFKITSLLEEEHAHDLNCNLIVLVKNPPHNPRGDFIYNKETALVHNQQQGSTSHIGKSFTFSGIGLYKKEDFKHLKTEKQALAPLLRCWAKNKKLYGVIHQGAWQDIGTPERLDELNKSLDELT